MKLPVSIIIPTLNEEKYLPKLLSSIQEQTLLPQEVIVVDAFSKDKTKAIAEKFSCKIIVDKSIYTRARNIGAQAASQPILIFLDADVVLPSQFLEKTLMEMQDRNLDVASCYVVPLSNSKIDHFLHSFVNFCLKTTYRMYPHAFGFCIFVKKDLHDLMNGFDETLVLGEDHDYALRASKLAKFSYLKSYKIPVSMRRFDEEGRLALSLKYMIFELQLLFSRKIRWKILPYTFGQHS